MREETIARMRCCPLCSPWFDENKQVLAHEIRLHVRTFWDTRGFDSKNKMTDFRNELHWAPLKGHKDYEMHQRLLKLSEVAQSQP